MKVYTDHRYLIHFYLLFSLLNLIKSEFTNDRKRIGPINEFKSEHGCLEKFTITENSIIRTEESKRMGAQFLNESDVGNREDCFHLCCLTKFCDVAVFEDKESGACFLFNCGLWEDPKCAFTPHKSYVTAQLKMSRHILDLGMWSMQRQQEKELTNLRSLSLNGPVNYLSPNKNIYKVSHERDEIPLTTTTPVPTTTSPIVNTTSQIQSSHSKDITTKVSSCSRFEFECHSGECIAIYNVCDGISQCKDNSDENDPALDCPQATTQSPTPLRSREPQRDRIPPSDRERNPQWDVYNERPINYDNRKYYNKNEPNNQRSRLEFDQHEQGLGFGGEGKGPGNYDDFNSKHFYKVQDGDPSEWRGDTRDDRVGLPYNREYPEYGRGYNPPPPPPPPPRPYHNQHSPDRWDEQIPRNQDQENYYPRQPPPINPAQPNLQTQQFRPRQNYQQNLRQPPISKQPSQIHQQMAPQHLNPNLQRNMDTDRIVPVQEHSEVKTETAQTKDTNKELANPPKPASNHSLNTTNNSSTSSDSNKSQSSSSSANLKKDPPVAPPDRILHTSVSRFEVDLEELEIETKEQEAQASGAILALSLGVCITALLIVLVGCRLKGVQKRLRKHRGGKSYAHDADYLVNGMYL